MNEYDIEKQLIENLKQVGYVYRKDISCMDDILNNFRNHFNRMNHIQLSDNEFQKILDHLTSSDVFNVSSKIREVQELNRDDGSILSYSLLNMEKWCKNEFEVVSQITNSNHRYDVLLLINGLPLIQIELKNYKISPTQALEQIIRYKENSNLYSSTLMSCIQIFIVSNGSSFTRYFANNNRDYLKVDKKVQYFPIYQWTDKNNKPITNLTSFTKIFLEKCFLAEIITRYMVLVQTKSQILILRPYQIYAIKAIETLIHENGGNGYIWHTTGSGKTLTSFKASTILRQNPYIFKCLFVVDRKDLDRQTREEFNKFQKDCVTENYSSKNLVAKILSSSYEDKIIVTTIQKLGIALKDKTLKKRLESIKNQRFVFIFDECHRSQFGENHQMIKEFFHNAQMIGFTGTPIFEENSSKVMIENTHMASYKTTNSLFEKLLHSYTIKNAIEDGNVLKFHVEHIDSNPNHSSHKKMVVQHILKNHDAYTSHRLFNSIMATNSISEAISYYKLFKEEQQNLKNQDKDYLPLHIACIFTPSGHPLQQDADNELNDPINPEDKAKSLKILIEEYNNIFNTNHRIEEFDNYYQDVQKRIKDHEYKNKTKTLRSAQNPLPTLDIIIVVDMLLTGFDAPFINTLYVDKKSLRYHHLIQAFSRTNRILNGGLKPQGNIIDFVGLQEELKKAVSLFSHEDSLNINEIWFVKDFKSLLKDYEESIKEFHNVFKIRDLETSPAYVSHLKDQESVKEFAESFKKVRKIYNQLQQYVIEDKQEILEDLMPKSQMEEFTGAYITVLETYNPQVPKELKDAKESEAPLEKDYVLFEETNVDYYYILSLISEISYQESSVDKDVVLRLLKTQPALKGDEEFFKGFIETIIGERVPREEIEKKFVEYRKNQFYNQYKKLAKECDVKEEDLLILVEKIKNTQCVFIDDVKTFIAPYAANWKEIKPKQDKVMIKLCPLIEKELQDEIKGWENWKQ